MFVGQYNIYQKFYKNTEKKKIGTLIYHVALEFTGIK